MTDKERFPSQKLDQYMLRFPDGMRDRIKAAATENGRSMNAEIISTLEEAYPAPKSYAQELLLTKAVMAMANRALEVGSIDIKSHRKQSNRISSFSKYRFPGINFATEIEGVTFHDIGGFGDLTIDELLEWSDAIENWIEYQQEPPDQIPESLGGFSAALTPRKTRKTD